MMSEESIRENLERLEEHQQFLRDWIDDFVTASEKNETYEQMKPRIDYLIQIERTYDGYVAMLKYILEPDPYRSMKTAIYDARC